MEEKTTTTDNNAGVQSETASVIERADTLAKRLEESNKKTEELLKKQEELEAKRMLAGRSSAGFTPVVDAEKEATDRLRNIFKNTAIRL